MKLRVPLLFLVALSTEALPQNKGLTIPPECDHALIMQKLEALQPKGWKTPEVLSPLVLGSGGWILAVYTLISNRKGERWKQQLEQMFESLRWFEGDTQKRSIGIAIVEANQEKFRKQMGKVWASVLTLQAKHILTKSKPDNETEYSNLERILKLLSRDELTAEQRNDLCSALKYDPQRKAGLDISDEDRSKWLIKFQCAQTTIQF